MFSLSTSLVPVARPTTTVSLRKNTSANTKVRFDFCVFLPFFRFFFLFYLCVSLLDLRGVHHLSSKPRRRHHAIPFCVDLYMFIRVILMRLLVIKSRRKNYHNAYYQRRMCAFSIIVLIRAHIGETVDDDDDDDDI